MMTLTKTCRVCGSTNLMEYLNLGQMPLSNNLMYNQHDEAYRYPLNVLFCNECSLSQLGAIVDPKTLFSHYVYRSSISKGYRDHCRQMAIELGTIAKLTGNFLHIDIAGNDGALLKEFRDIYNHRPLNIDPAKNLKAIAERKSIETITEFWSYRLTEQLLSTHGKAQLITATNVFAHVDRIYDFLNGISNILTFDGIAVLEFPYLVDFIERKEFDTVYFEHLSYFLLKPLRFAASKAGLGITHISRQDIHGGSLRIVLQKNRPHCKRLEQGIQEEKNLGYHTFDRYSQWSFEIQDVIYNFRNWVVQHCADDIIYGFAASAKGNTLLNACGLNSKHIYAIIDQTPEKIGRFSPGTGIPIYDIDALSEEPDYLVLLAWNFTEEIVNKCINYGYRGKFINPLTLEIIDAKTYSVRG